MGSVTVNDRRPEPPQRLDQSDSFESVAPRGQPDLDDFDPLIWKRLEWLAAIHWPEKGHDPDVVAPLRQPDRQGRYD